MSLSDCKIIKLPKIVDSRGNLSFIEQEIHIPFRINRVYYLFDVPSETIRGGHAHLELHQFIIALSGSFDVLLDDGKVKKNFFLNKPNEGLLVKNGIWRELINFSSGSVCLVLASHLYDESDYIRNYETFLKRFS